MDLAARKATLATLLEAGRLDDVEALCRPILARRPNDMVALQYLSLAAMRAGKPDQAVLLLRRATKAKRGDAGLLTNLGVALKAAGKFDDAVTTYREALKAAPDFGEIWFNLGNALNDLGRYDDAEAAYQRALTAGNCRDGGAAVFSNLGLLLERRGAFHAAVAAHRQAIVRCPGVAEYHFNLGNALRADVQLDTAIRAYDAALQLKPEYLEARLNQSLARLLQGDFVQGFAGYEARLQTDEVERRDFDVPIWNGEPLAGRRLLIYAEQGYGDTIQFLRYLPMLDRYGGRIVVEVQPGLRRLVEVKVAHDVLGQVEIVSRGDPLPSFDFHVAFMSLPHVVGFDPSNIPGGPPYLWPDPTGSEDWPVRLACEETLRIGLVWAGNRSHRNDRNRSIAPGALLPLFEAPGVDRRFYSLQIGANRADLTAFPTGAVTDLAPFLDDFADTAAAICALDVIICVDTSVAHLAAALGKPVELLLPHNPDWRWLLNRSDSPWYPTVRLHRQKSPGDWGSVVTALAAEFRRGGRYDKHGPDPDIRR